MKPPAEIDALAKPEWILCTCGLWQHHEFHHLGGSVGPYFTVGAVQNTRIREAYALGMEQAAKIAEAEAHVQQAKSDGCLVKERGLVYALDEIYEAGATALDRIAAAIREAVKGQK